MKPYKVTVTFNSFGLIEPTPADFAAGLYADIISYREGMGKYFEQEGITITFEAINQEE